MPSQKRVERRAIWINRTKKNEKEGKYTPEIGVQEGATTLKKRYCQKTFRHQQLKMTKTAKIPKQKGQKFPPAARKKGQEG